MPGILNENNTELEHPLVFDSEIPTSINNSVDQPEKRNLKALTNIRLKNQNRPIIGQLNINSSLNKFDFLCSEISPSLDLLLVSETKLDDSFPTAQFLMSCFCKQMVGALCFILEKTYHLVYLLNINHLKM